ncbi:MAG: HAD-IA family hydrolase [Clostridiales bacterium]|nr:HAD-IA family hydrolase [Clostridiales bacterium]
MLKDIEVVFFDLFYTLIVPKYKLSTNEYDVVGLSKEDWEEIAEDEMLYSDRATGRVTDPKQIILEMIEKAELDLTDNVIENLMHIRKKRFKDALIGVDEDIIEVLKKIKEAGIKLCLISNADIIDVMYWKASPLCQLFDDVVFSYEVGCVKPDAEIYEIALNKMNTISEKCLFVGDGGSDELKGAKQLGITTAMAKQFIERDELKNSEDVDYVINKFSDLCHLLKI